MTFIFDLSGLFGKMPVGILLFLLLFTSVAFIIVTTIINNNYKKRIVEHNLQLGYPMSIEYGWLGVRIVPILPPRETQEKGIA